MDAQSLGPEKDHGKEKDDQVRPAADDRTSVIGYVGVRAAFERHLICSRQFTGPAGLPRTANAGFKPTSGGDE